MESVLKRFLLRSPPVFRSFFLTKGFPRGRSAHVRSCDLGWNSRWSPAPNPARHRSLEPRSTPATETGTEVYIKPPWNTLETKKRTWPQHLLSWFTYTTAISKLNFHLFLEFRKKPSMFNSQLWRPFFANNHLANHPKKIQGMLHLLREVIIFGSLQQQQEDSCCGSLQKITVHTRKSNFL